MLPHGTGMLAAGRATDDDDAYFDARARSGIGLIIAGGLIVHQSSVRRVRKSIEAFDENSLETLRRKASVIHRHGVAVIGQLLHLGRESVGAEFADVSVAPSAVRSPRDSYPPHELDRLEIASIVEGFASSAANLKAAGFNGTEIHAAHGYLVAQFLSPATNLRDDAYGGDEERRFRFLRETVEAIRERCGTDFVLGIRLSADEELADGNGVRETLRIVERIAALEAVDYLSITIGVRGAYVKDITWPEAPAANAARAVRGASSIPVIAAQRITRPETAERLLEEGAADLVGMARAFIADAEWASKAARGEAGRIRPCIGLLQDCRSQSPHLHCAANPATGRERLARFATLARTDRAKRIAVVGGGPAGMEAARIAAERGHSVSLFEATEGLGGQFLYAASLPRRGGLRGLLDHLTGELRRLGVPVELTAPVRDAADLPGSFETIVIATGAAAMPLEEGARRAGALSCFDVLANAAPAPSGAGRALLVDDGTGFWWTYGVAELLIAAGWRVLIAAPGTTLASAIPQESLGPLLARLGRGGTEYRICSLLDEIGDGTASLMNVSSGLTERVDCDLVVIQTARRSVAEAAERFRDAGIVVHMIGDCVSPRRLSHAMYEAQKVGRSI